MLVENRLQPVMDCNNKVMVPTYDISKNDELKQRQRLLDRLNRAASNILMRNRMLKRLRKIQDYIRGGNQETAIDTPGGAKQQAINAALVFLFRLREASNLESMRECSPLTASSCSSRKGRRCTSSLCKSSQSVSSMTVAH